MINACNLEMNPGAIGNRQLELFYKPKFEHSEVTRVELLISSLVIDSATASKLIFKSLS